MPDATTTYTPASSIGPCRAADYFAMPEASAVELFQGWLVPKHTPTADLSTPFDIAYRAVKGVVDARINEERRCNRRTGRSRVMRRRLLIEVRSAREGRTARPDRLSRYARLGVEEYWFIDPVERYMLFHVLEAGRYVIRTGVDNRYRSPKSPAVEVDLASFWREVDEQLFTRR